MSSAVVYTVGHSNHEPEAFADLLQHFGVNCLVDVRSVPASGRFPQFNKVALSEFLKGKNIQYLHFGKEFGARHTAPELLDEEGKVDFEKVRQTEDFKSGVARLRAGLEKGYSIALMCSEADPFDCHRFSMISGFLEKNGFEVKHILKDKTLKTNLQLENQLLKKYHKQLPFAPSLEEQVSHAYLLRNKDVAFSPFSADADTEEQI
ncbi:MAG: DUF488 domain-containing protein [Saprospiraceae bacterium]|nr:DUF488 domain-containing protein [Saprospiraceae bacterium]